VPVGVPVGLRVAVAVPDGAGHGVARGRPVDPDTGTAGVSSTPLGARRGVQSLPEGVGTGLGSGTGVELPGRNRLAAPSTTTGSGVQSAPSRESEAITRPSVVVVRQTRRVLARREGESEGVDTSDGGGSAVPKDSPPSGRSSRW
jgi:hypothetical protein